MFINFVGCQKSQIHPEVAIDGAPDRCWEPFCCFTKRTKALMSPNELFCNNCVFAGTREAMKWQLRLMQYLIMLMQQTNKAKAWILTPKSSLICLFFALRPPNATKIILDFCFAKGEKYPDFSTDDTTSFKTLDGIIENVMWTILPYKGRQNY